MGLYEKRMHIFKSLASELRLRIVDFLQGGEKSADELCEIYNLDFNTLSDHMELLIESLIVEKRVETINDNLKEYRVYYKLNPIGIKYIGSYFNELNTIKVESVGCPCGDQIYRNV